MARKFSSDAREWHARFVAARVGNCRCPKGWDTYGGTPLYGRLCTASTGQHRMLGVTPHPLKRGVYMASIQGGPTHRVLSTYKLLWYGEYRGKALAKRMVTHAALSHCGRSA